jgi:hypothetical protein
MLAAHNVITIGGVIVKLAGIIIILVKVDETVNVLVLIGLPG